MANTFELIASSTVGSGGAANIDFTSIASTWTDLCLVASVRGTSAYTFQNMLLKINGATTNGSTRWLKGDGSSATSASDTPIYSESMNYANSTSNTFSSFQFYFPNYLSSAYKSVSIDVVTENNATAANMQLQAGLWSNTSAITSLGIYPNIGNFVQYSTAYLYGVKNA
jgi:hypothetical protein